MALQILIVDDEPLAQDIMETYILKIPGLAIAGKCNNALGAFSLLNRQHIDVMLLDINMPEISGIDFLKSLKNPPLVIFTTAYSQFAVESYDLSALDYLVKPISFERFLKAINKLNEVLQVNKPVEPAPPAVDGARNIMFVKTGGKLVKVDVTQLWFVEGLKDYVRLWTDTGKIVVHSTMKNFEDQLSQFQGFLRVNKSYIVNMKYISEVDGNMIKVKDQMITIGNTYRNEIHQVFSNYKIL